MAQQIPQRGRDRRYHLTPDKKRDFLHNLERLGSVDAACGVVKVHRHRVDEARRDDPKFRKGWADAATRAIQARVNDLARGGRS